MCLGLTGMLQAQTNSSTDSTSTAAPRSYHWSLGFVGGMERELISVGKGAGLALGCELVGAAALWKGGVIRVR